MCLSAIDDTGCPTSQSVSPSKTPSGSEQSAQGSPILPERKTKVKRVRVMAEWSGEPRSTPRHKRELRSAMKARGKEELDVRLFVYLRESSGTSVGAIIFVKVTIHL